MEHSASMWLQLQQAVETFRVQMSLLVQIWGLLIAADAILLGYALAQHKAVLLLAASGMPILMFLVTRAMYLHCTPLLYVAVRLERELMPNQDTLAAAYGRMRFPRMYRRVIDALDIDDLKTRDRLINERLPLGS